MEQDVGKYKRIIYTQYAIGIVFLLLIGYGAFAMRGLDAVVEEKVAARVKEEVEDYKKTQSGEQMSDRQEERTFPASLSEKGYVCDSGKALVGIGADNKCQSFWSGLQDVPLGAPSEGNDLRLSTAGQIYDWIMDLDFMKSGDLIKKSQLADKGKLDFKWGDSEVENSLTIDEDGEIDWLAMKDYPEGCPAGYAVQTIGDTLGCVEVSASAGSVAWSGISSFPSACGADQAVQAIGDTLTCVDLTSGGSLFTDGGTATYLSSQTDDFILGGTDDTAPFYFDVATGQLAINNIKVGGATDNVTISSSGSILLNGAATVWDDLKVPVTSTKTGGSKDPDFVVFRTDGAGSQGVFSYNFDAGIEEELYFIAQLPHGYRSGSDIHPHVHWSPTNAGLGNVVWGMECTWSDINDTFGNSTIVEAADAADGTAGKHQVFSLAAMDGTGKSESSMLVCRIFRKAADASDTYAGDAALLEIDFHYEIEKLGTDSEF